LTQISDKPLAIPTSSAPWSGEGVTTDFVMVEYAREQHGESLRWS